MAAILRSFLIMFIGFDGAGIDSDNSFVYHVRRQAFADKAAEKDIHSLSGSNLSVKTTKGSNGRCPADEIEATNKAKKNIFLQLCNKC